MDLKGPAKTRRNIYMGQEYLDLEAIAVNERKRTGRGISVADLVRKACKEFTHTYWKASASGSHITPLRQGKVDKLAGNNSSEIP